MAASGTVVELRVHGVSGTPPEALLSCPTEFLEEVAGDKSAGFYRRQPWIEDATSGPPGAWRKVLEAYSWGGLTSGPASRAVWLLFLPFIFINLAHWMLPPATKQRFASTVSVGLLRLIALSFTLTLMLAAAVAVMDVMVWQCMGLDYCGSTLGPLSFMVSAPRGVQVALSAVPLVVVIAVLWRLGRENTRLVGTPPNPAVMADEVPLESDTFWSNDPSVLRLRACHVMAWTAGLGALTLAVPARYAATPGVHAVGLALLAANGVVLAIAVLTTAWNRATARGGVGADWLTRPLLMLRWVSLVLLVGSLAWVATADIAYPPAPTHFPGLRGAIYVVLGTQVVLLLGLFVFTALSVRGRRRTAPAGEQGDGYRPTLGGFTAPFVALIGWLIGGGFSVGVGLWTAQVLGNAVLSTAAARSETASRTATLASDSASFADKSAALDADAPLIVPPPYFWAAVAIVLLIVVAIITGVWLWWWITHRTGTGRTAFCAGRLSRYGRHRQPGQAGRDLARMGIADRHRHYDRGGVGAVHCGGDGGPGGVVPVGQRWLRLAAHVLPGPHQRQCVHHGFAGDGSGAVGRAGVSGSPAAAGGSGAVGCHHLLAAGEPPVDAAVLRRAHGARTARPAAGIDRRG